MSLGASDVERRKTRERMVAIKSLKCINAVQEMLKNGIPPTEVARYIQEDAKELRDKQRDSLVRVLRYYIEEELPAMGVISHLHLPVPRQLMRKVEQLDKGVHTLTELKRLYAKINDRLERMERAEEGEGKFTQHVDHVYLVLLKYLAERHKIEVDLGLAKPLPPGSAESDALDSEIVHRFGDSDVAEVLANPESRRRILGMLQAMTRMKVKKPKSETEIETVDVVVAEEAPQEKPIEAAEK